MFSLLVVCFYHAYIRMRKDVDHFHAYIVRESHMENSKQGIQLV